MVIAEIEKRQPGIFGQKGAFTRLFAITTMISPMSTLLSPLISGALKIRFGYSVMNYVMGELDLIFPPSPFFPDTDW